MHLFLLFLFSATSLLVACRKADDEAIDLNKLPIIADSYCSRTYSIKIYFTLFAGYDNKIGASSKQKSNR